MKTFSGKLKKLFFCQIWLSANLRSTSCNKFDFLIKNLLFKGTIYSKKLRLKITKKSLLSLMRYRQTCSNLQSTSCNKFDFLITNALFKMKIEISTNKETLVVYRLLIVTFKNSSVFSFKKNFLLAESRKLRI